jgi:Holliday junction resolvasome RuvABC DNA-binding subunit
MSNSDDGNQYIDVTPQEKQDIEDLVALGYDENLVLQYYLVCDRDKQATASMLMSEKQENEVSTATQTLDNELSEEEKKDIDELVSMGFSRVDVLQYYIACDKNKEATANMIMQNMFG